MAGVAARRHDGVGRVALQRADPHRLALGMLAHAGLLAELLGRADAGAHAAHDVGRQDGLGGPDIVALGDLPDEERDVDRGRAGLHAGRVVAEVAALGLDERLVPRQRRRQIGEVLEVIVRREPPAHDAVRSDRRHPVLPGLDQMVKFQVTPGACQAQVIGIKGVKCGTRRQTRAATGRTGGGSNMPDIIALGEPMVELNRPKGEDHYRIGCGGDVSNAMVAAARSGASTGMATAVGDDEFGHILLDLWRREGVDDRRQDRSRGPDRALFRVAWRSRPQLLVSPRGLGREPLRRRGPAARGARGRTHPARVRDQPGDLDPRGRRRLRGHGRGAGRGRAAVLRHEHPPEALADRPRPRRDPRGHDQHRYRAARPRRRQALGRGRGPGSDRRPLPVVRCPHRGAETREPGLSRGHARSGACVCRRTGSRRSMRPAPGTRSMEPFWPNTCSRRTRSARRSMPIRRRRWPPEAMARSTRCRDATPCWRPDWRPTSPDLVSIVGGRRNGNGGSGERLG